MRGPSACMPRIHLTGTGYSSDWTVVWKMVQGIDDGEGGQVAQWKLEKRSKDKVKKLIYIFDVIATKDLYEVEGISDGI